MGPKWNTYGDLPNADLLRRYGHVDELVLEDSTVGNPKDVTEIRADLIVDVVRPTDAKSRIEFWLEEGGDE